MTVARPECVYCGAPRLTLACGDLCAAGRRLANESVDNGRVVYGRCDGTLGSRPEWMSPDQYDPCQCRLTEGHDGPHWCEHLGSPRPPTFAEAAP